MQDRGDELDLDVLTATVTVVNDMRNTYLVDAASAANLCKPKGGKKRKGDDEVGFTQHFCNSLDFYFRSQIFPPAVPLIVFISRSMCEPWVITIWFDNIWQHELGEVAAMRCQSTPTWAVT